MSVNNPRSKKKNNNDKEKKGDFICAKILKKLYSPLSAHSNHPIPGVLTSRRRTPGMGCFECADSGGYSFFKISVVR